MKLKFNTISPTAYISSITTQSKTARLHNLLFFFHRSPMAGAAQAFFRALGMSLLSIETTAPPSSLSMSHHNVQNNEERTLIWISSVAN